MFIDTSAFVEVLASLPKAARVADAIAAAKARYTSSLIRLEASMVLSTRLDVSPERAQALFDAMIGECDIEIMPVTDTIARASVAAFAAYGKGRGHPAQLNLADCVSYACAKTLRAPILFIGDDFSQTDLASALWGT